jgi:hypothetical protein
MVETKTARGSIERGNAINRHVARTIDNDIDGASVVCSFSSDRINVAVEDGSVIETLEALAEYNVDIEIENDHPTYSTGQVRLVARS